MIKKDFFILIIQYLIIILLLLVKEIFKMESIFFGVVICFIAICGIFKLYKKNMIFSPLIFSKMFLFTFGLFLMQLTTSIGNMKLLTEIVIIICMILWDIIIYNNIKIDKKKYIINNDFAMDNLKMISIICFIIGAVAMIYEWFRFGSIPILADNLETSRFNISAGSFFHVTAISLKITNIFLGVYTILKYKENNKIDFFVLSILCISTLLLFGLGSRAELLFPIVILLMCIFEFKKVNLRLIIKYAIPIVLILMIYPIIRNYSNYGKSYINDLKRISKYEELYLFTPLYETFSYNIEIFRRDTEIFPEIVDYGLGTYTILNNIPFVNLGKTLTAVQNEIFNNKFYAGLACTYMGFLYADGGYLGCILGTVIIALIVRYLYNKYIYSKNITDLIIYFYVLYNVLLFVYHYTWNEVFYAYLIYIFLINILCKKKGCLYEKNCNSRSF